MSIAIDTATKLHQKQIHAVTRSQDLVVSAVERVAAAVEGLRAKSPNVPDTVAGPLEKVTAPLTKVVGNKSEVTSYLSRSPRNWVEAQHKLQSAVLEALVPDDQPSQASKAKAKAKAKA